MVETVESSVNEGLHPRRDNYKLVGIPTIKRRKTLVIFTILQTDLSFQISL